MMRRRQQSAIGDRAGRNYPGNLAIDDTPGFASPT